MPAKRKAITCDVLKILNKYEFDGKEIRVQVVSWNNRDPVVEKREYYQKEGEEEKMGKAKGFNLDDMNIIWDQQDDIDDIMCKKRPRKK